MTLQDIEFETADGRTTTLAEHAGEVVLVVNVASRSGLTPQYEGLEELQRRFGDRGFQVVGFPSNEFSGQEPGTDEEIQEFCSTTYGVSFPVVAKIDVNGDDAHPLFRELRAADPGEFTESTPGAEGLYGHVAQTYPEWIGTDAVKWNFTKFLIGRDGEVIRRYEPFVQPAEIGEDLETLLGD